MGPLLGGSATVLGDLLQQVAHRWGILQQRLAPGQVHPGLVVGIDVHVEDPVGGGSAPVLGRSGCGQRSPWVRTHCTFARTAMQTHLWPRGPKTGLATATAVAVSWRLIHILGVGSGSSYD